MSGASTAASGRDLGVVAFASPTCNVVEVEEVVEVGDMVPDEVHLPGIYVHRIVHNPNPEKRIEKRTITS